jgi:hypothetical protein
MSARRVYTEFNRRGFALPIIIIAILLPIIILLAAAPWVTEDFALNKLETYNPCPQLAVVPNFKTPSSSQKVLFGRKLIKTESACGIYDLFVSALGTVHQIKVYKIDMSGTSDPASCFLPEGCSDGSYPSTQKSETPDPTKNTDQIGANWKTYSNPEIKLTLQYPSDWSLEKQTVKPGDESQTVSFKGKEGFFVISWGSGFGGACPEGYEEINLKRESIKVCHGIDTDGNENWGGFSKILENTSFTGRATAYKPSEINREVILKIISTMEFSK